VADAASADLASLASDLSAASGQSFMMSAQQIIKQAAQKIQAEAQTRAPVKSGRLKASIQIRYTGPLSAIIGSNLFYAPYMEFGTGSRGEFPGTSYIIKPKNPKGVLVWTSNGKRSYAKIVNHPGVKARPFMRPAFEAVLGSDLVAKLADAGALAITKGPNA
jgi:HK97 gp10 family phage protein